MKFIIVIFLGRVLTAISSDLSPKFTRQSVPLLERNSTERAPINIEFYVPWRGQRRTGKFHSAIVY